MCAVLPLGGIGTGSSLAWGIRKQVWVCSADAGVCHAWKAAGKASKDIANQ